MIIWRADHWNIWRRFFVSWRILICEKNPEAFEKFEAAFPKKEKLKLLGQLF